eukprot:12429948-Karenia_brevis.AAC.1
MGPVNTILHMIQILSGWDGDVGRQWIKSLWDLKHAPPPMGKGQRPHGSHSNAPHGNGMAYAM